MKNKEIENMKEDLKNLYCMLGKKPSISTNAIKNALNYIEQLETKVKELGKGQHTLIQSRKKWKNRYYKNNIHKKEV